MIKTSYQTPELRDANDNVVQEGAFGKNTALSNSTNDGWIDYVMNDLEALHDTIGDSAPTLDGNGHVVEPANLAIGDEDGIRLKTGYLKTSGGTVSGTLNIAQNLKMQDNQENVFGGFYVPASSATSQYLQLYGGETPSNNGGNLQLPSDGSWTLQAKNGTTAYNLVGGTDGTLKWRGNNLAYDAQCIHIDGAETIIGQKTFTVGIKAVNGNSNSKYQTQITGLEKGIYPSSTVNDIFWSGYDSASNRIATIQHYFYSSGAHSLELSAFPWVAETVNASTISVGQNADGTNFTRTNVTPPQSSNSTDIATTSWVTTKLGNYLPLRGGALTGSFSARNGGTISIWSGTLEKGVLPASDTYIPYFYFADKNGNMYASIRNLIRPDGDNTVYFFADKQTNSGSLGVRFTTKDTAANSGYFSPTTNGYFDLGIAVLRWKEVFATTGTINTSDERLKDNIAVIPDTVLDAWGEVGWYQYQFKDAIEEKGEAKARLHTGTIAQRIKSVFETHGLDAFRYGLLCYDEWDADSAVRDEKGNILQPARPAGNQYSLRYEEALCMEAAYQRRRADRLEERIARLEALISE